VGIERQVLGQVREPRSLGTIVCRSRADDQHGTGQPRVGRVFEGNPHAGGALVLRELIAHNGQARVAPGERMKTATRKPQGSHSNQHD